jgi:hypothetical protein
MFSHLARERGFSTSRAGPCSLGVWFQLSAIVDYGFGQIFTLSELLESTEFPPIGYP